MNIKNGQPENQVLEELENAGEILQELAAKASKSAIAEDHALGLAVTYLLDGKIVQEYPDGRIEVVKDLGKSTENKGQ